MIKAVKGAKTKSGLQKYRVRINYTAVTGEYKQLTRVAIGFEQAKLLESTLTNEYRNRTKSGTGSAKLTLDGLYADFVKAKGLEVRESTLQTYSFKYAEMIRPMLGNTRIDRLSKSLLQDWKNGLGEKGYALSTRQGAYRLFNGLLEYATRLDYLPSNPLRALGNFKETLTVKPDKPVYTLADFERFIAAARQAAQEYEERHGDYSEWAFYVFFFLAFHTGMRRGEILALRWSDLDGGEISVRRSVNQSLPGGERETAPKSLSSVRNVLISDDLNRVLGEHRQRQEQVDGFSEGWRICGGARTLCKTLLGRRSKKYAMAAGVHVINIHAQRHSYTTRLIANGGDIQAISEQLGHSNATITMAVYAHLLPHKRAELLNVLNRK
ncbi:MAG: site-specific integrase [Oscillospiraceae bacterium]|uniref:Integrase n=1 Tax=uncultured bacterium contig00154 TaxID=1181592 RepID=A0A806KH05_9BACT|nr:integrase [uncultured bacterium contig00154]MDR0248804.1 site-specific integrase [Oscillospiraceae bacterium]